MKRDENKHEWLGQRLVTNLLQQIWMDFFQNLVSTNICVRTHLLFTKVFKLVLCDLSVALPFYPRDFTGCNNKSVKTSNIICVAKKRAWIIKVIVQMRDEP